MSFSPRLTCFVVLLAISSQVASVHAQKSPADARVVKDSDRAAVAAALPGALQVSAKQPRKVLVFSRSLGYYHKATPLGKVLFESVQQRYGDYTFVLSDEPEDYAPEKLKQYDAIVFNNCTQMQKRLSDPATQKGIITFVEQGGGFMGIHAAADGGWTEYNQMLGSRFAGHPWGAGNVHAFQCETPSHGMTACLSEQFKLKDEIYVSNSGLFDRSKFRVLVSMDLSDLDTASKPSGKTDRADKDYSVSHIRPYGKGRVFYTTFGHNDSVFFDPKLVAHLLAGLQYVTGDLEINDQPVPLYDRLKAYSGPLYFEAKLKLMDMARRADDDQKVAEVIGLCTRLIQDASATADAKQVAIEALGFVPTQEAIDAVISAVSDEAETVSHAALAFLSMHVGDEAFLAICRQLSGAMPEHGRINLVNAMAARGERFADSLYSVARKASGPVRVAAIKGLGHCGTARHADGLEKLTDVTDLGVERDIALIGIADRLPGADASAIYEGILSRGGSFATSQAALLGIVRSNPSKGQALVLDFIAGSNETMKPVAIAASAPLPGEAVTLKLAERIPAESYGNAVALIQALSARTDPQVPALLEKLLPQPAIRQDVIEALGSVGTASQAPALVALLAEGGDIAKAASRSLSGLRADGIDAAIAGALEAATVEGQIALLKICSERRTPALGKAAMKRVTSEDKGVASAALKTVALCGAQDELAALCEYAVSNPNGSSARSAIAKLAERLGDDAAVANVFITQAKRVTPAQRKMFVDLLGDFQTPMSAQYLAEQVDGELAEPALKALAGWEDNTPMAALRQACEKGTTEKVRDIAFTGYAKLAGRDDSMSQDQKLAAFVALLKLAGSDRQRIAALKGLSSVAHSAVEKVAGAYLQDANSDVANAAKDAVESLRNLLSASNWKFSSNMNNKASEHQRMIDLDPGTRWTSNAHMSRSDIMWLTIDLGYGQDIKTITLDTTGSNGDFPRKYELYVSEKADDFGSPIVAGQGATVTEIACNARGRYLKIVQNGKEGPYWSIHELKINGRPDAAAKKAE